MSGYIKVQSGYAVTEGDELFYKLRGNGPPLLLIAPGGGDGDQYLPLADALADEYTVITYDRRANARSTRNFKDTFDIRQQSRDALAVLNAVGYDSAYVFGNSSGAVIALDMAAAFPSAVRAAVIHEAPVYTVLSDADKWKAFFESCYAKGIEKGAAFGATKFFFGIDMPALRLISATLKGNKYAKREKIADERSRMSSQEASEVLIKNELLPVTGYVPKFEALKQNHSKIIIACGEYGLKHNKWYAEVSKALAAELNCELVKFPGHHGSFMDNPTAWSAVLRGVLGRWQR